VLRERGFLNSGLEWLWNQGDGLLGLAGMPDLLGDFQPLRLLYNLPAVVIALIHVHLPFMVLPLYATLEKLDRSYLEASLDLGASQWRTLSAVTVPLVMPGIASGVLLTFILSLGSFLAPDLLGGTEGLMIGNLIAHQFGPSRDWAFGSALSFLIMYATFIVLWIRSTMASRSETGLGI
jgi:spermidine/putrescine transport system permease protein